jgi:hypothetical protein
MPGRMLMDEARWLAAGYRRADLVRRRAVLRETLAAFDSEDKRGRHRAVALRNLARWRAEAGAAAAATALEIRVLPGDWGDVTGQLTRERGVCFAALNMANAYVPGGAYVEGTAAQEENMFRRTDCHYQIGDDQYDASIDRYRPEMTRLLSAADGAVYLDTAQPRVCMRGAEDRERADLGYRWLADDEIFPFFELRAAAQDMRGRGGFDAAEARRRIAAQLDTLRAGGVRHAVLSAFGCGAFENPADVVATIYRDELAARRADFSLIAFAIFAPGYGPDNYAVFASVLAPR